MKAYLTSIGEQTTELARWQLERLGFHVIVLDGIEPWEQKYMRFLETAREDCIRVDADVVLNREILQAIKSAETGQFLMAQWNTYDLYKNKVGVTCPVFYTGRALKIIRRNLKAINWARPEATAWRLPEINDLTLTGPQIVGIHGFCQTLEDLERHRQNKIARKQISDYDFKLAEKLFALFPGKAAEPVNPS